MENNKAVVRALVEAINGQDWGRIDALVSADFTRHSDAAGQAFPDAHESLEELVAEGNKVAARLRFQSSSTASNEAASRKPGPNGTT